jgi:serine/threonine-protein kinase RsbW
MQMSVTLQLPRDALSIPVMRGVLTASMRSIRVEQECIDDIAVAITEACTNVLELSLDDDKYEVTARITESCAEIAVIDTGHGFDADSLGHTPADSSAESGRGIQLMRALVDRVAFESRPASGTVVHLQKNLKLQPDSPLWAMPAFHGRSGHEDDPQGQQEVLAERGALLDEALQAEA